MEQRKSLIYDTAVTALFTAVIVLSAWISVPVLSVPFTLQTLGVFIAVLVLGAKRGALAVFLYIILGAVGLPVFHSFQGGIGVLMSSTGGFILGFLLSAPIIGLFVHRKPFGVLRPIFGMILAQLVCYIFGVLWFCFVFDSGNGIVGAFFTLAVPFLLPDALKIILALIISKRVSKYVK